MLNSKLVVDLRVILITACYSILVSKPSLSSDFGSVGLIDIPTARMSNDGSLLATAAVQSRTNSYALTYQATPWLSSTFRYTGFTRADFTYDRNYEVKFRLFKESEFFPQIATGLRDIAGSGLWSSEYLVASKKINNFDLTLGVGWGRLAGRGDLDNPLIQLSDKFENRQRDVGFGGKLSYKSFFSGKKIGFFGGVRYALPNAPVDLMLEFNPDQYDIEVSLGSTRPKSPLSMGVRWAALPGINLTFSSQHHKELGIELSAMLDTKLLSSKPTSPLFVSSLDMGDESFPDTLDKMSWYDNLLFDVERSGILILEATIDEASKSATIVMGNTYYPLWIDAIDVMTKLADLHLPLSVNKFNIIVEEEGYRIHSLYVPRPSSANTSKLKLLEQEIRIRPVTQVKKVQHRTSFFTKRILLDINLANRVQLFDPDDPARYQIYAKVGIRMMMPNNWILSGAYDYDISNNFDESTRLSDSRIQKVRSDVVKYLTEGDTGLDSLYVQKRGNLNKEILYRVFGGVLESMYSGFGGEILYQPFRSRVAFGLSMNWVKQRDYDKTFKHLRFQTSTAFASMYWSSPYYNLDFAVHAGKYLARDLGSTLEIRRTFDNGWMVGVWATATNVSSRDFGEGSFDKGLFFKIPLGSLLGSKTRGNYITRVRPIQRDGGQYLEDFMGTIFWDIRAARYDVFSNNVDRLAL